MDWREGVRWAVVGWVCSGSACLIERNPAYGSSIAASGSATSGASTSETTSPLTTGVSDDAASADAGGTTGFGESTSDGSGATADAESSVSPSTGCEDMGDAWVCEDFEEPWAGWFEWLSGGEWERTTEVAHSGTYALRVSTPQADAAQWFGFELTEPQSMVHVRTFVRFEEEPVDHACAVALGSQNPVRLYVSSDQRIQLDIGGEEPWRDISMPWPLSTWMCLQLAVDLSNREIVARLDGDELVHLDAAELVAFGETPFISVGFGLPTAQTAGNEMYIDDFAAGPTPIACD